MKVDELTNATAAEFGYRGIDPNLLAEKSEVINALTEAAMQKILAEKDNLTVGGSKLSRPGSIDTTGPNDIPELDPPAILKGMDDVLLKLVMYLEEQRSQDSMELVTPKIIRVELDEKQGHQCN